MCNRAAFWRVGALLDEETILLEQQKDAFVEGCGLDAQPSQGDCPLRSAVASPEADRLLENTLTVSVCSAEPLTRREDEILRQIVAGRTNKEIARRLCRSERTVEYHRNRLMRKIGARNAAELVKRALAMGIV